MSEERRDVEDGAPNSKKQKLAHKSITFQVDLKSPDVKRVFSIDNSESLDTLAQTILQIFGYVDNTYSFHLDGIAFSKSGTTYYSPRLEKTPDASTTLISDVPFPSSSLFLYDYSDEVHFLLSILNEKEVEEKVEVEVDHEKSVGEPPKREIPDLDQDEFDLSDEDEEDDDEEGDEEEEEEEGGAKGRRRSFGLRKNRVKRLVDDEEGEEEEGEGEGEEDEEEGEGEGEGAADTPDDF